MAANLWSAVAGLAGGLTVTIATAFLMLAPDPALLKGLVYEGSSVKDASEASLRWYNTPGVLRDCGFDDLCRAQSLTFSESTLPDLPTASFCAQMDRGIGW